MDKACRGPRRIQRVVHLVKPEVSRDARAGCTAHREVILAAGPGRARPGCASDHVDGRLGRSSIARVFPGNVTGVAYDRTTAHRTCALKAVDLGAAAGACPMIRAALKVGPRLTSNPGRAPEGARRLAAMSTVLRMSSLFVRTLRDDPADAEVPSHRLLVRAGYIRRNAPGHLHLAAARPAGAAQDREHHPRRDGRASARRSCCSRRCCPASPTRRPAAGPSTATASSGSRTARAPTTCSVPRTRRCSPSW